ncbi:MAG: hypothetical protein VX446_05810, partial [Bacteroidota bacterium]|nr:hypothetical protein [Bacteroidota bacterium]
MEFKQVPTCCATNAQCQSRFGPDAILHGGQCVRLVPASRYPAGISSTAARFVGSLSDKERCRLLEGPSESDPCWVPPPYKSVRIGNHCFYLAPVVPHDVWYTNQWGMTRQPGPPSPEFR